MSGKTEKTPRELSIEKAEGIVIAIGVYFILFDLLTLLIVPVAWKPTLPCVHLVQWTITFGLCFMLYRGKHWARFALALISVIGLFASSTVIYRGITLAPQAFWWAMYFLVFLVIPYGLFAYLLLFSSDIDELIRSRNA